ncbi:hypothetical protein DY000_02007954 [Brassica cretica]|uniref:Uncharacterized protein n=1 Tax=Brassica cretica TaxID=69181 RepID=A0ABQ7CJM9_BRACR|nr:hypothetical protein DY000_02007954 [Brassica cretica]
MEQATAGQIQNQDQRQPQSNRQAVPATGNIQPDELKGLGMMMQQLLTSMQIHGKALNQVSTDINTRMDNMFTELNTKCTLPGKNVMNPRVEHCNTAELRYEKSEGKEPEHLSVETVPDAEGRTEHSASSKVTAPDELAETPPVLVYVPKVPYPIPPIQLMDPISAEQLAGFRKMVKRLP